MNVETILFYSFAVILLRQWVLIVLESRHLEAKSVLFQESGRAIASRNPRLSVIFSAKNEEATIEQCVRSIMGQKYSPFEVIVINDRSSDRTGNMLDQIKSEFENLKVIHISSLPTGWLGKNHALSKGAQLATGEYILFTDADIIFESQTFERAMKHVVAQNIDHLVLQPKLLSTGPLLPAMLCYVMLVLLIVMRPSQLGRTRKYYVGAGAFNLVRRSIYDKSGGHERLRLEVIDDLMLGKLIMQVGGRQDVVNGMDLISLSWYSSTREMIVGLEKNGFALLRYSNWKLLLTVIGTITFEIVPYFGVFSTYRAVALFFACERLIMFTVMGIALKKFKFPLFVIIFIPLAPWLMLYTYLRSAYLTIKRKGVVWRGTLYPLDELKKHMIV